MFVDPMLDAFRKMVQECEDKNYSGEAFDKMIAVLQRMENLADECDDFNQFNAILMQEGLQLKFSQHYGELLSNAAKENLQTDNGAYDDDKLMATTLKAYEDSMVQLSESEGQASAEIEEGAATIKIGDAVIPVIKQILDLGKSGISYPVFLTKLIENGWESALSGMVAVRDVILKEILTHEAISIPPIVEMHKERLAAFDTLAEKSSFGIPDPFEFNLKSAEVQWKYEPVIDKWGAIKLRMDRLFDLLYDWLDAYCSFAPNDARWRKGGASEAQVRENIRFTKGTNPGFLKERERILYEYFGIKWEDIFEHEVFLFHYNSDAFKYAHERFDLIKKTHPHCKPLGSPVKVDDPPADLIALAEQLHSENRCLKPKVN